MKFFTISFAVISLICFITGLFPECHHQLYISGISLVISYISYKVYRKNKHNRGVTFIKARRRPTRIYYDDLTK